MPTSVSVSADRGGPFDLVESESETNAVKASTELLCCCSREKTSCELPVYVLPISYSPREWQLGYNELREYIRSRHIPSVEYYTG